jgi:alkyl sulfatase BDS1-like metallo-beta-lactamase superfamily hydrolase
MNALLSNLGYPEISGALHDNPTHHLAPGNIRQTENVDEYFVHHLPEKIDLNAQELKQVSGSIRYIINGSEPTVWTLNLDQGKIEISYGDGAADCTLITDRETLLRLANNESSMIEEILKDRLRIEGDIRLAHVAELVV